MDTALEHILTNSYKDGMIQFLMDHPEAYEEAILLAVSDKQPYSWRAAWLLWSCMEKNDPRIKRHVKALIEAIPAKKDGHQRELFKILSYMDIEEDNEGILFAICMDVWEKIHKQPSVRWHALSMILKMAEKYPELKQEIHLLTQEQYLETLSPGIRYSIAGMVKGLSPK